MRSAIEEAIAGAIPVFASVPLVVVEGNYLLHDGLWSAMRGMLDSSCYVSTQSAQQQTSLLKRHMSFGRTREEALAWMEQTDEPNVVLTERSAAAADFSAQVDAGD